MSTEEKTQAMNEIRYLVAMGLAKKFLNEDTITRECYKSFDTKMQQKYRPTWSKLFTDLKLDTT